MSQPRRQGPAANWEAAKAAYPATADGETGWARVLIEQPDILWAVIADIVKVVKALEGPPRTGRRPGVSGLGFDEVWELLYPQRYSLEPFVVAAPKLMAGRSQHQIAPLVPCNQATLSRLLAGRIRPDLGMLEGLARALKVPPTYFVEYRAMKLAQAVQTACLSAPHLSVTIAKRLAKAVAPA